MHALLFVYTFAGFLSVNQVRAEAPANRSSSTAATLEEVQPEKEKNKPKSGTDVDEIITNKKMRAESGSKSRWSIGSAFNYAGGPVDSPLNENRPNLRGAAGTTAFSSLTGHVGAGYKLTTTDRLGLDVGVRWITPLQKNTPKSYSGTRADAEDPSLTYSKAYKLWGVQSVVYGGPTLYTQSDQRQIGYSYGLGFKQINAYEFGHTGFTIGLIEAGGYNFFDRNDPQALASTSDYSFAVLPFLEYVINDTFNLRTVFSYATWQHMRDASTTGTLTEEQNFQSVGLGISITRDIFLYPNLQFAPYNITNIFRADATNVALNANINVF